MKVAAIIGAGGIIKKNDLLRKVAPYGSPKALIPIAGRPMIQWVLDAVLESKTIQTLLIIGLQNKINIGCPKKSIIQMQHAGGIADKLICGAKKIVTICPDIEKIIWISADVPLITGEMLDWYSQEVFKYDFQASYQIVDQALMEAAFPGANRTLWKLKDRKICLADVNCIDINILTAAYDPNIKHTELFRKSPIRLILKIGLWPFISYLSGKMTEKKATSIIQNKYNFKLSLIKSKYPEMAMDIDRIDQYYLVEKLLKIRLKRENDKDLAMH